MNNLTWAGVLFRFIFALCLVLCTYNPSGYSYFHWVAQTMPNVNPYIVLSGLVLIAGWVVYAKATMSSLGVLGIVLITAVCACFMWLMIEWGWISLRASSAVAWLILLIVSLVLTVGMCWSHISRKLSGQVDTDDVET